jgi:hypothetical protein
MVHTPVQQSAPRAQTSPSCVQYEAASWHLPVLQSEEQQSAFAAQSLPAVLHAVLSAWQVPPVQVPPQHCAPVVQAFPSDTHVRAEHAAPMQESEQHSVPTEHGCASALHAPIVDVQ